MSSLSSFSGIRNHLKSFIFEILRIAQNDMARVAREFSYKYTKTARRAARAMSRELQRSAAGLIALLLLLSLVAPALSAYADEAGGGEASAGAASEFSTPSGGDGGASSGGESAPQGASSSDAGSNSGDSSNSTASDTSSSPSGEASPTTGSEGVSNEQSGSLISAGDTSSANTSSDTISGGEDNPPVPEVAATGGEASSSTSSAPSESSPVTDSVGTQPQADGSSSALSTATATTTLESTGSADSQATAAASSSDGTDASAAETSTASGVEAATSTPGSTEAGGDLSIESSSPAETNVASSETITIETGDATAVADVLNTINVNTLNSELIFELLTVFGNLFGEVTLDFSSSGAACPSTCKITRLLSRNVNTADVSNTVDVSAQTGANSAIMNLGDVSIATGDAYAAANVINVINTNFVDSQYLSFILNAFGSWTGDIVLPPESFFKNWESSGGSGSASFVNDSGADISSLVSVGSDTGANTASGSHGASVETGDASAATNLVTVANTNMFGGNSLLLFVRTFGTWKGHVFSLPEGMTVVNTPDGVRIEGMDLGTGSTCATCSTVDVSNSNDATLVNRVHVNASTGANTASSAQGNASIRSGNAFAAANIINLVNVNMLGKNWLFAILNIFGDWEGDIAFGRPNLWIGSMASRLGGAEIGQPGGRVQYTYAYRNNGNARATNVRIRAELSEYLRAVQASHGGVIGEDGIVTWTIPKLEPGEFGFVVLDTESGRVVPDGTTDITNTASVTSFEDDGRVTDNAGALMFAVSKIREPIKGGDNYLYGDLQISKERKGLEAVYPGDIVDYVVKIWNQGPGSVFNIMAEDVVTDVDGNAIHAQSWDIGEILAHEEILLEYSLQFATSTEPGIYTNTAIAQGSQEYGLPVSSVEAKAAVEVLQLPELVPEEEEISTEPEPPAAPVAGPITISDSSIERSSVEYATPSGVEGGGSDVSSGGEAGAEIGDAESDAGIIFSLAIDTDTRAVSTTPYALAGHFLNDLFFAAVLAPFARGYEFLAAIVALFASWFTRRRLSR